MPPPFLALLSISEACLTPCSTAAYTVRDLHLQHLQPRLSLAQVDFEKPMLSRLVTYLLVGVAGTVAGRDFAGQRKARGRFASRYPGG